MLKLLDATVVLRKNRLQVSVGRTGKLIKYGEYLILTRDLLLFSPKPNMSHVHWKQVEGTKPPLWEPESIELIHDWSVFPKTSVDTKVVPWEYPTKSRSDNTLDNYKINKRPKRE